MLLDFNFNTFFSASVFLAFPLSLSWHAASDSGRGGGSLHRRQQRKQGKDVSADCGSPHEVLVPLSLDVVLLFVLHFLNFRSWRFLACKLLLQTFSKVTPGSYFSTTAVFYCWPQSSWTFYQLNAWLLKKFLNWTPVIFNLETARAFVFKENHI